MKRNTKVRKIREFKKELQNKFGIEFFNIEFKKFRKISNDRLDEFFELIKEKLSDANSWGRHVESIYWSETDKDMGIVFYEHGDYSHQFMKTVSFDVLDDVKNFGDFVIKIKKGLFIDTSDLYL